MKPIFLLLLFSSCVIGFSTAQNPLVKKWDYRFGGKNYDYLFCTIETKDKGFLLGGASTSGIGGQKSDSSWGQLDYWIVKIDSLGNKEWDKDYGGTNEDQLQCVYQTFDGGYILGGFSASMISGDKTMPTKGGYDYWIVKIDSLGNIQWDKDFGALNYEFLYSIEQTSDTGYIIGGWTMSGANGDKTEPLIGVPGTDRDFWIIKTDSLGNKQWDRDLGGDDFDQLEIIQQDDNGDFVMAGWSHSDISGNKTSPNWDPTGNSYDFWVVKVDPAGNVISQKDYGGKGDDVIYSMHKTTDAGYILSGFSGSDTSGDKSEILWGNSFDYWMIKIDSLGNKQWDKDLGGTGMETWGGTAWPTFDGGYFVGGNSYSQASGNKSEDNLGIAQAWVLKIDSVGNVLWDKTILTFPDDGKIGVYAFQSTDSCFIITKSTTSGTIGDKSQQNNDTTLVTPDYWIIKYCEEVHALFTAPTGICPGTCADFTNLSFTGFTFQWYFPGGSPDTSTAIDPVNICYNNPGSYDVTLIAYGNNKSDTLTLQNYITVYPHPAAQSITQSDDTLFAIPGAYSYQWYFNGNSISAATDYFYVATENGNYNVVATDTNGCEVEAVINDVLTSAQAAVGSGSMQSIQIYPNPVIDKFTIQNLEVTRRTVDAEITVYNIMGEKMNVAVNWKLGTANCQLLPAGLYYLEITSEKKIFRTKFVKQ